MNIMDHVDVLDLIRINVIQPNIMDKGAFQIDLVALAPDKRVIVDPDALAVLEARLLEKTQEFKSIKDPRLVRYIKEFTGKMCSAWHRNGLLVLEDIPEASDDPYAAIRSKYK